jgi:8-oxo-dGDP phosphatase
MTDTPAWMSPKGRPWQRANAQRVFENHWISVTTYDAVAPTGRPAHYGLVHMKSRAIGVLPIFEDGRVLLVGQHRFTFSKYSWEIPEGGGRFDEAPEDAARRELKEEAGLEAAQLIPAMQFDLSNSVTDEHGFGYIAIGLTETQDAPDDTEDLALARVPFREALDLATGGAITDMITVAMLLRAYHMAREGGLPRLLADAMMECAISPTDQGARSR